MTYVDAIHNKQTDEILIVERINGQRVYNTLPAKHVFYYEDPRGTYKTMWGIPCAKYETTDNKKFRKDLSSMQSLGKRIHEHDINPIFRCLSENYLTLPTPELNIGFFDIEVDFDPLRGYAPTHDPFAPITAISLHLSSTKRLITLVLKPELPQTDKDYLTWEAAENIVNQFDDTILCNDEEELLKLFLDAIEDADVLSGWNSTGFDIPYVVNRIERILGKDYARKMCLWDQRPKKRKYIKFKKEQETYDLIGRVHLDYLELFQKHSSAELHSYKLDHVGEVIVGENKTPYEGSLDALYKRDFKTFIEYNRQDTLLLVKIDAKCRYIELANQLAHTNSVLLQTTMGSVALIEQAIVNETWSKGMQVMSRPERDEYVPYDPGGFSNPDEDSDDDEDDDEDESNSAVGAYVADPKKGMHKMIGCVDINSLYPSALRALNMGPETLVGQIRLDRTDQLIAQRMTAQTAGKRKKKGSATDAWHGLFATIEYSLMNEEASDRLTVDFVDGETATVSGKDLKAYIFESGKPYVVTANGTIFRTDVKAIIPGLLERWYAERKQMQAEKSKAGKIMKGVEISPEIEAALGESTGASCSDPTKEYDVRKLDELVKAEDVEGLKAFMVENDLSVVKHKIKADPARVAYFETRFAFWDQRQLARKILLNSLYGALLNEGCRFYDKRIGQSVTLSGRSISKHMNSKVNECITGEYQYDGAAIVYADTDSSYFSAYDTIKADPDMADMADVKDSMLELYKNIGDIVNESFPIYMNEAFNTGIERGSIIAAGLELVANTGMFIKKKRYAVLKFWDEDTGRLDIDGKPGKIKAMGLDLKRADTPKFMQDFLSKILLEILTGVDQNLILEEIKEFRNEFRKMEPWEQGTPKKVNGLTGYQEKMDAYDLQMVKNTYTIKSMDKVKKDPVPGHVRASINWNRLKKAQADHYSSDITDGGKVIVCKLLNNPMKLTSVAYPYDQRHLPEWFKKLPFDTELMEETIIDKKINNLIGVLKWDLSKTREDTTFNDLFDFI
jgi:DNA polymerase elongation subunit (family B)